MSKKQKVVEPVVAISMSPKTEKIVLSLPWSKIVKLAATLFRSVQGGISKAEGEVLMEQLSEIIVEIASAVK